MLASVEAGIDPRVPDTCAAICDEYLRRATIRTKGFRQVVLKRLVYPSLGSPHIDENGWSEIVRLLDKIEDQNGPVRADQTLAFSSRVMNCHASRSDDFRPPIVRGMARTKRKERARDRTLTDDELRAIWRTAEAPGSFGRFVRFILLTACRSSEAAHARWSEITGGDWIIPSARYKTGKDHLVPLSGAARGLLSQGDCLFGPGPVVSIHRHRTALAGAFGVSGWTLHDQRRTARSLMSRGGVATDHAGRCLGHVVGEVHGTYDRHEYREEKAPAFEALAAQIERIVNRNPRERSFR